MLATLVLLTSLSNSGTLSVVGQYPKESHSKKKVKMQLYFMGYLYLPEGFKAYKTDSWIDAWFGYIVSPDNKFRINYSAGMVQTPFEHGESGALLLRTSTASERN